VPAFEAGPLGINWGFPTPKRPAPASFAPPAIGGIAATTIRAIATLTSVSIDTAVRVGAIRAAVIERAAAIGAELTAGEQYQQAARDEEPLVHLNLQSPLMRFGAAKPSFAHGARTRASDDKSSLRDQL